MIARTDPSKSPPSLLRHLVLAVSRLLSHVDGVGVDLLLAHQVRIRAGEISRSDHQLVRSRFFPRFQRSKPSLWPVRCSLQKFLNFQIPEIRLSTTCSKQLRVLTSHCHLRRQATSIERSSSGEKDLVVFAWYRALVGGAGQSTKNACGWRP